MNSVDVHLDADSKAATLLAMRSARKEIVLIVEGDHDVRLFSNILGLPTSNILSCGGKAVLMDLVSRPVEKGLDEGSIFIRDRDHDQIATGIVEQKLLMVTSHYDIEMDLLSTRIFKRIYKEYAEAPDDDERHHAVWSRIIEAGSKIGALRFLSLRHGWNLSFDNLNWRKFLIFDTLELNAERLIQYFSAKDKVNLNQQDPVRKIVETLDGADIQAVACGKDILEIIEIAFSRFLKLCDVKECSAIVLDRMLRSIATLEDFTRLPFYPSFKFQVDSQVGRFEWPGRSLP